MKKAKEQKSFRLLVSYKGQGDDPKKNKQIEELVGKSCEILGYHFIQKEKDMVFYFDTVRAVNSAKKKVEKLDWLSRIEVY